MTNRLELNWKLDGFVDEQRYYCSETPIDASSLPAPKAILPGDARTYTDSSIELEKRYHVRIGSVKNNIEKLSDEIVITTSSFIQKMYFIGIDDVNIASRESVFRGIAESLEMQFIPLTFSEILTIEPDGLLILPSMIFASVINGWYEKLAELHGNGAPVLLFSYGRNGNVVSNNALYVIGFAKRFGDAGNNSSFDFVINDLLDSPFNKNLPLTLRTTSYYTSTVDGLSPNAIQFCKAGLDVTGAVLKPGAVNIHGQINASTIVFCSAVYFSPSQGRNLNATGLQLLTQIVSKVANRAWD